MCAVPDLNSMDIHFEQTHRHGALGAKTCATLTTMSLVQVQSVTFYFVCVSYHISSQPLNNNVKKKEQKQIQTHADRKATGPIHEHTLWKLNVQIVDTKCSL